MRRHPIFAVLLFVASTACTPGVAPRGGSQASGSASGHGDEPGGKNKQGDDATSQDETEGDAVDGATPEGPTLGQVATPSSDKTTIEPPKGAFERRPLGEILCQEGPRLAAKHKDDFSSVLGAICDGATPGARYERLLENAYAGEGAPEIEVVKSSTDELYVSQVTFAYAIRIPVESPDKVADLDLFGALEGGLSDGASTVTYEIESRTQFPGQGSLEEIRGNYRTLLAEGAALYDKRRTYINQYVPSELTRDITVTLESLLDAETNEHYHASRQMVVGVKNSDSTTSMIYVVEVVIKNRIDPARVKRSLLGLAKASAKMIHGVAVALSK